MADKLDGEWLEALGVEDTSADDTSADDDTSKDEDDTSVDDDKKEDADDDTDSSADDNSSDDNTDDGGESDEETEPDEKTSTKEAIKEALQEIEAAKTDRSTQLDSLKTEVVKTLYPEGINRQLRDADGDPITGIDDLTKLINPRTGELFTDEEAGAWLLNAQQKLNKDVEAVERFVEQVAEVNLAVTEGAKRVAEKYGDILSSDENLRNRLLQAYDKTLVKDQDTGITLRAPVDVEEFFSLALDPRIESMQADLDKKKAEQAAKDAQKDRGDLKPSGKSDNVDPEDKEWAEAIKKYEEGVR